MFNSSFPQITVYRIGQMQTCSELEGGLIKNTERHPAAVTLPEHMVRHS